DLALSAQGAPAPLRVRWGEILGRIALAATPAVERHALALLEARKRRLVFGGCGEGPDLAVHRQVVARPTKAEGRKVLIHLPRHQPPRRPVLHADLRGPRPLGVQLAVLVTDQGLAKASQLLDPQGDLRVGRP